MDPAVSMAEQGVRTPHDPQTAVREEVGDDEVIYSFTQEAESTMPKNIRRLLVRATQTKATEIAVEEENQNHMRNWSQNGFTITAKYSRRNNSTNYRPEDNGIMRSN